MWRSILYRGLTRYRDTTVEWLKTYDDGKPVLVEFLIK